MSDPKGVFIPAGHSARLTVECIEEMAIFYFDDSRITERFARFEIEADKKKGMSGRTSYSFRLGKAVTKYPNKSKEEVRDIVLGQLKKMNLNAKIKGE